MRLSNRPLSSQFLFAGGVVGAFSIVSIFLLLYQVQRQTEASRWLAQSHRTIARLNTLGRDFYQQQTAIRDFVETRDPRRLSQARERQVSWEEDFGALKTMVVGNSDAEARLADIGGAYLAWSGFVDGIVDAAPGREQATDLLQREGELFRDTFLQIDTLIDRFNRQLSVRDGDEKQAVQQTFAVIAVINIALVLIFSVVLMNLYQSIARPLANLSAGLRKYMGGDFRVRVPVTNKSEIGYLESTFNEMAERIEVMVRDLRALDEMKSDFLSTVSHELRTPLTSIGGYVKLLLSGDADPISDTQKEFLYIVDTNVVRLTNLINELLDVEKIESGKIQLVREPQDVISVLRECRDTFVILARQKNLDLLADIPEGPLYTVGDRARLVQVFMNLLSNAIKYTKKGYVQLSLEQKDYAMVVRIKDTGVGLAPEELEKLFQKFYRSRSALASAEAGTGLGLVIARGLIEAHGGSITVESEEGVGTTFSVSLPVEDLAAVLVEDVREVEGDRGLQMAKERSTVAWERPVWLVGKDADQLRRTRALLAEPDLVFSGYKLKVSEFEGVGALPSVLDTHGLPELVILDLESDETGGKAAIESLAGRLGGRVPFLVIGASVDTAESFSGGASAVLKKPVKKPRFVAAVKDLLHTKGRRVLVADADPDVRLLIKRSLEQRGFEVDDVDRGNQILSRLERERYDLLLLGREFPDVTGLEILRVVRRLSQYSALRVLFFEDEAGGGAERREAEALGIDGFVARYKGIAPIVDSVCQFLEEGKS